jgi:hypothetical protein
VLGERGVAALDLAVRRHGGDTSGHDDDPSVADVIVPPAGLPCYVLLDQSEARPLPEMHSLLRTRQLSRAPIGFQWSWPWGRADRVMRAATPRANRQAVQGRGGCVSQAKGQRDAVPVCR